MAQEISTEHLEIWVGEMDITDDWLGPKFICFFQHVRNTHTYFGQPHIKDKRSALKLWTAIRWPGETDRKKKGVESQNFYWDVLEDKASVFHIWVNEM